MKNLNIYKMLRSCFITLLLAVFIKPIYSQYDASPERIDSLVSSLKKLPKDSTRMNPLVDLWRAHVNRDIDKAFYYASELITLGKEINHVPTLYTGYQRMGITYYYLDNVDKSNEYYRKGLQLSIRHKEYSCIAVMHLNIGLNHLKLSQHDSAIYHSRKSAENFLVVNDSSGYAGSIGNISSVYYQKGQYKLSLEYALKGMRIYESYTDKSSLRDALYAKSSVSDIYLKMKDTTKAIEYYEEIISAFREQNDKYGLSGNLFALGNVYSLKKNTLNKSKALLTESKDLSHDIKSVSGLINSNYGLGIYYRKVGLYKEAKNSFTESMKLSDSVGQVGNSIDNQLQLSEIAFLEKDYLKAIQVADKALNLAINNNRLEDQIYAYEILYQTNEAIGKTNMALSYHKKYKRANDSIYNIENGQKLSELQIIYETEKKEAAIALQKEEINTLNEKAKVDSLTKGLYAGGALSGVALSGLLFFGFRQRVKKNKIAREKQEEIYKKEIEHKKKELASQTLHLVQKNTFIQELKENLENLKNSPEKFKTEFRRIVMLLKKENASDKDWEVFKTYFADVHNDFDQKLKTLNDSISEKEIRLASFLRMKLSTKEIAATINVLPESILTSKYRLKKKLGLAKEVDLTDFLNTL